MKPSHGMSFYSASALAGWAAFFSPAAFVLTYVVSLFRDHYGVILSLIGRASLYVMVVLPAIGFTAGIIALIGAAIYKNRKMRIQGLVGVLGILCIVSVALFSGIASATVQVLAASSR